MSPERGHAGPGTILRAGVVIASVAAVAVGCTGHGRGLPPADPSTSSTSAAALVTVKVGFLGARRGDGSALSRAVEDGERLAVSQFTGGHPRLDVVVDVASTGGTPAGAATAAARLVADGVVAVVGPQATAEMEAAAPVLSVAGIPVLTATATATPLAESGWTTFFRVVADDQQQGVDEAEELVTSLHVASLAVLAGSAVADRTRAVWVASVATGLEASVALEASVTTSAAAADAADRIVGSGVSGVYFSGPALMARALVTDLSADGYQGVVLIASDTPASVLQPLGPAADGVYVASAADDPAAAAAAGGAALVFNDAYRAAFGANPPVWAAEAYDATDSVLDAVASGATTGPEVAQYLFNHPSVGVSATVSFDSNGDLVNAPVFISQIRNGTPVQIAISAQPSR